MVMRYAQTYAVDRHCTGEPNFKICKNYNVFNHLFHFFVGVKDGGKPLQRCFMPGTGMPVSRHMLQRFSQFNRRDCCKEADE